MNKTIIIFDKDQNYYKTIPSLKDFTFLISGVQPVIDFLNTVTMCDMLLYNPGIIDEQTQDLIMFRISTINRACSLIPVIDVADTGLILAGYKKGALDYIVKSDPIEINSEKIKKGLKINQIVTTNNNHTMDMVMAEQIQYFLMPNNIINKNKMATFSWSKPINRVGGDIFDSVFYQDGRTIVFIADIRGHGIAAAMLSMTVKILFNNVLKFADDPGEIFTILNKEINKILPSQFFLTMFCAVIYPETKKILYANAGHTLPVRINNGNMSILEGCGTSLGPQSNVKYETFSSPFDPKDIVFLYTDGLIEKKDIDNQFKQESIIDILKGIDYANGKRLYDQLLKMLFDSKKFNLSDDCSFMIVEYSN